MTEQDYLNRISAICSTYGAKKVLLFGSRAVGTNAPNSDFDIAVYGTDQVETIREELDELPTLFSADVVDMESCRNKALIEEVEKYGVPV